MGHKCFEGLLIVVGNTLQVENESCVLLIVGVQQVLWPRINYVSWGRGEGSLDGEGYTPLS